MSDPIITISQAMTVDLARMRTISQNIANINTPGYRSTRTYAQPFSEHLRESDNSIGMMSPIHDFVTSSPSTMRETGRSLDLAAEGQAFFVIQEGERQLYTKNGAFQLNESGQLVTSQGRMVLGESGPIQLTTDSVTIDTDGNIKHNGEIIERLKLVELPDSKRLKPAGDGLYIYDGMVIDNQDMLKIRQGKLENSTTQPAQDMVDMMEIQRHFESVQRSVVAYDLLMNSGINTLGNNN